MDWQHWSYGDWNRRLVDHYLGCDPGNTVEVDQLPAAPEDLATVALASVEHADDVAAAFVRRIVEALPHGEASFCGFCFEYRGWTTHSPRPPHFFAMLWFTCLVAYGYPSLEGSFNERLWKILGKAENFQLNGKARLPDLWKDLAAWTRNRRAAGDHVRVLVLPPDDQRRKVIGHSHFLAFPNRHDRSMLARVLTDNGLAGYEPPIQPAIGVLTRHADRFSKEFREDFDSFVQRLRQGEDPRNSAFWRAVRNEALDPSADGRRAASTGGALVFMANEDGLLPLVAWRAADAPSSFELRPFEGLEEWTGYLVGDGDDVDRPWREVFARQGELVRLGHRKLIEQGVLVLRERASGVFDVVAGPEIQGCCFALVRNDLRQPFIGAFGGNAAPSIVPGWTEIVDARIEQLDELPGGLPLAVQFLRTMAPPSVSLVGGVRVGSAFLAVPEYLPRVRAPSAISVRVRRIDPPGGEWLLVVTAGDWALPIELRAGEHVIEAAWPIVPGAEAERRSETALTLVSHAFDDDYKPPPTRAFYVESCPEPELAVAPSAEVVLGITSKDISADFLELDSSARYLGPGLGEMSPVRAEGVDWFAVGSKKHPELLVFVGDPEAPVPPAACRSPRSGDRAQWRRAWGASRRLWRTSDGEYRPLSDAPTCVRNAFEAYRRHEVGPEASPCRPAALENASTDHVGCEPHRRLQEGVDVLAGLAVRRSGLTYAEVREVFVAMTGHDDPTLFQQVLRSWVEVGMVDVLRRASVSRLLVVPRRPRFVLVRRGPELEATLVGLVTSRRRQRLAASIAESGLASVAKVVSASNPWQPTTLRLRASSDMIEQVRIRADLTDSEWLDWPHIDQLPPALDVAKALRRLATTEPASSYRHEATWDWELSEFRRDAGGDDSGVIIERRRHRDGSAIYVVTEDGRAKVWSALRSWILLAAHAMLGTPPFAGAREGKLWTRGRSPMHLPLPLGRLCTIIGDALPGLADVRADELQYSYPFGRRLFALVQRAVPASWIQRLS